MYTPSDAAFLIKEVAKNKGISVKTMLEECGLNKNLLSSMTTRLSWPQANNLARIADYLDCSVDYLLGRTDDPNAHKKILPAREGDLSDEQLTAYEQMVLTAYRTKTEMQAAVNTLLGIAALPTIADDIERVVTSGEAVYGKTRTTDAK